MNIATKTDFTTLQKQHLCLVIFEFEGVNQGRLYLNGNLALTFELDGYSFAKRVTILGEDYFLEVDMEEPEVGISTCFLYRIEEEHGDGSLGFSNTDFIQIEDASDAKHPYNPERRTNRWDIMVEVRANTHVTVVNLQQPINRAQAEMQGRAMALGLRSGNFSIEGATQTAGVPVNDDNEEIEL